MLNVIAGATILSVLHSFIPSHWLPIVVIGKSEGWSRNEILGFTVILSISHTLSTVIIGLLIGIVGYTLSQYQEMLARFIASVVLVALGLWYITRHFNIHNPHAHHGIEVRKGSKLKIISWLSTVMFFSPCIEIEAYYLSAGSMGWMPILAVSLIYVVITLVLMEFFVFLALKGMEVVKILHRLEHNENLITGIILVILGGVNLFVE